MDTRPLRVLLAANTAVFLLVCALFLLHRFSPGLLPGALASWLDHNPWLLWTAAGIVVPGALAIPPLGARTPR